MSNDTVLEAERVTRRFGGFTALKDVSAHFPRGRLTSIIGPNGAGKSTFFNVLSGALVPSEGRIRYKGQDITGKSAHLFPRMGIAKSFQITNIFPRLTALENVRVGLQAMTHRYTLWRARTALPELVERAEELLDRVGLGERRHAVASNLSHGEQRCLEIALALACDPDLLLLDEPTAGMSPEETRSMMTLIVKLAGQRTVVLVEHKMKLVMGISDRLIVLHHGELLAEGTPEEIRRNGEVKRVYLGQKAEPC